MSEIWMRGNGPLEGEVKIQGSKNAALPMMAAAVLHEGRTVLHNCPRIADVFEMEAILRSMGVKTAWSGHTPVSYTHLDVYKRQGNHSVNTKTRRVI